MKLKDQVCSLDLAKRLKELRVPQHSLFYWVTKYNFYRLLTITECDEKDILLEYMHSAFTVAELGEILTPHLDTIKDLPDQFSNPINHGWDWIFDANYWAKMLIYLLENNLISNKQPNAKTKASTGR